MYPPLVNKNKTGQINEVKFSSIKQKKACDIDLKRRKIHKASSTSTLALSWGHFQNASQKSRA